MSPSPHLIFEYSISSGEPLEFSTRIKLRTAFSYVTVQEMKSSLSMNKVLLDLAMGFHLGIVHGSMCTVAAGRVRWL